MMNDHSLFLTLSLFCLSITATAGWGFFILHVTGLPDKISDLSTILLYSGIIGVIIVGDLILIAGMMGYLGGGLLYLIFFSGVACGFYSYLFMKKKMGDWKIGKAIGAAPAGDRRLFKILFFLSLPFVILIFLRALAPDVSGDAYLYHITVPRYYALEGKIDTLPISFCYNYPLQLETYYLAALVWGEERAGVMMNFALLGLTCLGMILLCREIGSRFAGFVSVFIFLTLPIVMRWAPTSLVDLATAPFLLGSLLALMSWRVKGKREWLLLSGFCAGGAVAVKLFLGIAAFILIPILLLSALLLDKREAPWTSLATRQAFLKRFEIFLSYFAGVAIALLPWMFKNAVMTRNPFFPFGLRLFPTRPDLIPSAETLHAMHGIPTYHGMLQFIKSAWGSFSLLSWDGNWIIIIAMVLAPLYFMLSLKRRERRLYWGFQVLIVLLILYYGTNAQVRWFQGYFPFLVTGFSLAAEDLIRRAPSLRKTILSLLILLIYANGGWYYYLQIQETNLLPWTGLSGAFALEYIEDKDRFREAEFLNRHLPEGAKVLLYDMEINSTARWMERRFYQAGEALFNRYEEEGADIRAILKNLRKMGITHISGARVKGNPIFKQLKKEHIIETVVSPPYVLYELKYP